MFTLAVMPARTSRRAAAGTLRALWALVLATGLVAPLRARAQAPTDGTSSQSLWTRDTLGGDWGGFRSALGQHGIGFNFWATGFYQDLLQGAGNDEGDFSGRVDLMINGDTGKLGLWQRGGSEAVDRLRAAAGTIIADSPEFKRLPKDVGARDVTETSPVGSPAKAP